MTLFLILRFIYNAYFRFPHFSIRKASLRIWKSKDTDTLITCSLILKTKKNSEELVFEELWIDGKKYKFSLSKDRRMKGDFKEKEIVHLDVVSELPVTLDEDSVPVAKPKKGKVLLAYTFKNKKRYMSINKFKGSANFNFAQGI